MKKFIQINLLSITLCLALTNVSAQYVTIPDANFRNYLNQFFPGCLSGNQLDTTCSAVVNATNVSCNNRNIADLTGISYFDNLLTLRCVNNQLTSLPALPATLTTLDCSFNSLISLPALPPALKFLTPAFNQLTSCPSLPVTLKTFNCSYNQLTALPVLPASLTTLYCDSNPLGSLPALPGSLSLLSCTYDQLTSLPVLPMALNSLSCYNNQLSSLPALPGSLSFINCSYNQLTSFPAIPASVVSIYCYNNQLTSLPAIPASVDYLRAENNQLQVLLTLPDTINALYINNNPGLECLPPVKRIENFQWSNTAIICFPNAISVGTAIPSVVGVPIACGTPPQPQAISGSHVVCEYTSNVYSVPPTPYANNYTWTLPPGWTGTSTTNSITATAGNTGGTITVVANNSCTNSSSVERTINILMYLAPSTPTSIGVAGGSAKVCPGDNRTYSTPAAAGYTFNWTVPPGAVINSGQGTRTINVSYNSGFTANGILSVAKVASCGLSGSPKTINVNRNIPSTPSVISGTTYGLCGATNKTYSVAQVAGMTYQWTLPAGANFVNGQGTNSVTVNFPSGNFTGNVSVKAVNACGAGSPRNLTVRAVPATPVSINGPATACANQQNVAYNTVAVATATSYTWGVPSGALITSGQGTNSIVMKFGSAGGNVKVRASNGCGNGSYRNLAVTINCREGADNFQPLQDVLVYPNPGKNYFTIKISNPVESNYSLLIRDVVGRVVYEQGTISNDGFEFGEELKSGIYFAEIKQGNERKIIRLIKNK